MAKVATDGVLDASADFIIANFDSMAITAGQPADPSAIAAGTLAVATMAGGDYTKANGDVSGRKVTVGAKTGVSVTASGDADHVVLYNAAAQTASDDMLVTTAPLRTLANGDTVNTQAYDFEVQDPT